MKPILLFILALLITTIHAQNKQTIIRSGDYYYGSGVSFDAREARDQALEELTEQIAVRVSSSFERKLDEKNYNINENVKSILHTHSAATLKNVNTIKTPLDGGEIEVFCYLKKDEVAKIWEARKKLIAGIAQKAVENERIANVAFALKLNYFALLLVNSLPDDYVKYNGVNYTIELPGRINRIINNVQFTLREDRKFSEKERAVTVNMLYRGQPAALLDFTFWDGSNQVLVRGRDGLATFKLFGASAGFSSDIKLNIKYAYYEARHEYNVIADLWPVVKKPRFNASKKLNLDAVQAERRPPVTAIQNAKNRDMQLDFNGDIAVADQITASTVRFLNLIDAGDKSQIRSQFAGDPFLRDKLLNYLSFNQPEPYDEVITATVNKTKTGFELRKIRMLHNYPSINKQSTEYLVLDFDDSGRLIDINTSITENLYNTFVEQSKFGNDWDKRQQIIKFVEKYRTAYLTRDIETVDMMFAEDALILIGRKIKRKKLPDNMVNYQKFSKEPDYEYLKLTKQKYLERQRRVFNAQKDIFLDFSTFDIVKKNNARGVYGVEMRQNYASTTYADEGYLFLLIDFSGRDPLIYVRAWQPNEWSDSALVRTANFRIYK